MAKAIINSPYRYEFFLQDLSKPNPSVEFLGYVNSQDQVTTMLSAFNQSILKSENKQRAVIVMPLYR